METILDRTKKLAKEKGLSLSELEEKIGIAKTSIYSWKSNIPKGETIQKTALFFTITKTINWLFIKLFDFNIVK